MKNTILVLGFLFVGLLGFSQQNNEENLEILHQDQKKYEIIINNVNNDIILDSSNELVINDIEKENDFLDNSHEMTHNYFKVEENQFDYKRGVYTLNEYVSNYKLELITTTIK